MVQFLPQIGMAAMFSHVRLHTQVALWLVLLAPAFAENSVHIRSTYGQLVTSSTLQWVAGERGSHPENAVVGAHQIIEGMLLFHSFARITVNVTSYNLLAQCRHNN
jgi:hypothetical protein